MGWRGFRRAGGSAAGRGLQALSVGVDDAGEVREARGGGGDDVGRAAVEDAAFEQGNSADFVGVVPAASISAGVEVRRAGPDDVVGEEADAGARRREYSATRARQGYRDGGRVRRRRGHFPTDGGAEKFRRQVSGDREL